MVRTSGAETSWSIVLPALRPLPSLQWHRLNPACRIQVGPQCVPTARLYFMRSVQRNTPSGGLVGAAPLVVVRKSAAPPSAPHATPGGVNLGGCLVQPLANKFQRTPFGDGSTVAQMHKQHNPYGCYRTASCSSPSTNVRPCCMCGWYARVGLEYPPLGSR